MCMKGHLSRILVFGNCYQFSNAENKCFWATVCKMVHPVLLDRCPVSVCLSCLSVCNIGVLWPNGWIDQDET